MKVVCSSLGRAAWPSQGQARLRGLRWPRSPAGRRPGHGHRLAEAETGTLTRKGSDAAKLARPWARPAMKTSRKTPGGSCLRREVPRKRRDRIPCRAAHGLPKRIRVCLVLRVHNRPPVTSSRRSECAPPGRAGGRGHAACEAQRGPSRRVTAAAEWRMSLDVRPCHRGRRRVGKRCGAGGRAGWKFRASS